jgi:tetratricopeptide (TPR) repeat protein
MRTLHLLTVVATLSVLPQAAGAQTAKELNAQGFRLYKAKDYAGALKLFEQALVADPNLALAHYNFAATLGVFRKKGQICQHDAYKQQILDHLEKAVALDPARKERMKRDADFDTVRDTLRYQRLLGLSPDNPKDVAALLQRVSWFSKPSGIYGSLFWIDFRSAGVVWVWRRIPPEGDGLPKTVKLTGRYTVTGSKVMLQLPKAIDGSAALEGELSSTGELVFPAPVGPMSDVPSECAA